MAGMAGKIRAQKAYHAVRHLDDFRASDSIVNAVYIPDSIPLKAITS
jgi:hypothetical protein